MLDERSWWRHTPCNEEDIETFLPYRVLSNEQSLYSALIEGQSGISPSSISCELTLVLKRLLSGELDAPYFKIRSTFWPYVFRLDAIETAFHARWHSANVWESFSIGIQDHAK